MNDSKVKIVKHEGKYSPSAEELIPVNIKEPRRHSARGFTHAAFDLFHSNLFADGQFFSFFFFRQHKFQNAIIIVSFNFVFIYFIR